MSGIAGIIRFDGAPIEPGLVETMTGAMAYRGPDGIIHWVRGSVALGQCMLRTTPASLEETQPLTNEDESLVLVMDGWLSNWEKLRGELLSRNAKLRTRADAELVLRAYEVWGRDCLTHIDGDFAFVIWDARQREAFCARDRLGNKPFTYHWDGTTLVFASELHAILAMPWVPQIPNEGMIAEYLTDKYCLRHETLWTGVLRLVSAHKMTVGSKGTQVEKYWEPKLDEALPFSSDEDYFAHYRDVFSDCVRRSTRSNRPIACEVSGGLDSSAIFCMAEHLRRAGQLIAPSIDGYTLAFSDKSAADELHYARSVAEYLSIAIQEVPPFRPTLKWFKERAEMLRDFPGYPNEAMFVGILKKVAGTEARVVLTGEGGDQWLDGSRAYYAEALAYRQWSSLFTDLRSDSANFGAQRVLSGLGRDGFLPLFPFEFQNVLRRLASRLHRRGAVSNYYWLSPQIVQILKKRRKLAAELCRYDGWREGQHRLLMGLTEPDYDHTIERADRLAALMGIEKRNPMRCMQFVQFAFSTPERLRLRGRRTKFIHVSALKDLLPRTILERHDKAEFSSVFREHLNEMEEIFLKTIPRERKDWITPGAMQEFLQFFSSNPQVGWPIWLLWSLYACHCALPDENRLSQ